MRPVGVLLLSLFTSWSALAGEDEAVISLEGGYGYLTEAEPLAPLHGGGGGLTAALGISDALWLGGSVGLSVHPSADDRPGVRLIEGFAGLVAALDVLRTIPFVEVMLGGVFGQQDSGSKLSPTVRLGAGADYLVTPALSLGAVFRWRPVSDELGGQLLTVSIRIGWRIEL